MYCGTASLPQRRVDSSRQDRVWDVDFPKCLGSQGLEIVVRLNTSAKTKIRDLDIRKGKNATARENAQENTDDLM